MRAIKLNREVGSGEQVARELNALRENGISVFSVAVSDTADEMDVSRISSPPQVANINYFISPNITNLNSLSRPLATQVPYSIRIHYGLWPMAVSVRLKLCQVLTDFSYFFSLP